MKRTLALLVALAMALSLCACGKIESAVKADTPAGTNAPAAEEAAAEIGVHEFRLGTNNSHPHPIVQGIEHFAEVLSEKTNGKMTVTIYAGGQLGDKATQMQMVQTGALDFYTCGNGTLADAGAPDVAVYSLPYLFDNLEHAKAYTAGTEFAEMMAYVDNQGIGFHVLGAYCECGRCWFAKNELTAHPDCLNGLKLRSQEGTIYTLTGEAYGAQLTTVSFSELYSALQSGVVDGADQPISGFVTNQFQEICKYYINDQHEIPVDWILMSAATFASLNDAEKAIVQEAFNESVAYFYEVQDSLVSEYVATMEAAGVNIIEIDPKEWADAVSSVYDQYPDWAGIVEGVRNTAY